MVTNIFCKNNFYLEIFLRVILFFSDRNEEVTYLFLSFFIFIFIIFFF